VAYSRYYFGIFLQGLRKTTKKLARVPPEIRTEHLLNASLERYRYVKLPGMNGDISSYIQPRSTSPPNLKSPDYDEQLNITKGR
jgi:hypothetical protein